MSNIAQEILSFIKDENAAGFKEAFEKELHSRIADRIEKMKPEVAQKIFGFETEEEENEDI